MHLFLWLDYCTTAPDWRCMDTCTAHAMRLQQTPCNQFHTMKCMTNNCIPVLQTRSLTKHMTGILYNPAQHQLRVFDVQLPQPGNDAMLPQRC
jgi:hypothetical protein